MILNDFKEYPDGSDVILSLLRKFPALMIEQIVIFFLQTDKTFNRERVTQILNDLDSMDVIDISNGIAKLKSRIPKDDNLITAFWAFLHYANKETVFDRGSYPTEILFKNGDIISEIVVMDDESLEKMDYLSKRKYRKNKCKYIFVYLSDTIEEFDDELFEDIPTTLITIQSMNKDAPKLIYHEVN